MHGMPVNVSLQNIMAVMTILTLTLANKSSGGVWRPSTIATEWSTIVENFDNVSL